MRQGAREQEEGERGKSDTYKEKGGRERMKEAGGKGA